MLATKKRGRILFLLNSGVYPYVTGGMEVFNYYLIKSLKDRMDVRDFGRYPLDYEGTKHYKSWCVRPTKYTLPFQLFLHCLLHPSERNILISFSSAHAIYWYLTALVIRLLGIKSTVVIHYGKAVPEDHPDYYRYFFKVQRHVLAVSEDIKKNYDAAFGTNCRVIYPLVPFAKATEDKTYYRQKYGVPQDALIISMVGTVKGMKNPDTLIDALAEMTEDVRTRLKPFAVFAGRNLMTEALEQRASEKGVSEYVKFLGQLPKENVGEVMVMTDIYLIASDFEGTSVSLLEAMFNKKDIIISRAPGLVDMIEEGKEGLAFETRNASALKDCILEIVDNPQQAERRAEAAYARYNERYDYQKVVDAYEELLSE